MQKQISKHEEAPEKILWKMFASNFFQGLLIVAPIAITIYLIYWLLSFLDQIIPVNIPGLGLLILICTITFVGYLSRNYLVRPILNELENFMAKMPLVKIIFSSVKDLFVAFLSEERKLESPVFVIINRESNIKRLGFVTNEDMGRLGLKGEVAVYFPHSYNFSGNLFIVPRENIIPVKNLTSSQAMKLIISGGVAQISTNESVQIEVNVDESDKIELTIEGEPKSE